MHVVFVFTHDSIAVGEDGPTHEPVEQTMSLRLIPNLSVIRPADANETALAWKLALERANGPTSIVLSRQDLPILDQSQAKSDATQGGYILVDAEGGAPDVVLIATGSEVALAVEAREALASDGVKARVVSLPSWDIFAAQSDAYQESVLGPKGTARVSVEAGATIGWERYTGANGASVGIDTFGASGPGKKVLEHFGFTKERVAATALLADAHHHRRARQIRNDDGPKDIVQISEIHAMLTRNMQPVSFDKRVDQLLPVRLHGDPTPFPE